MFFHFLANASDPWEQVSGSEEKNPCEDKVAISGFILIQSSFHTRFFFSPPNTILGLKL